MKKLSCFLSIMTILFISNGCDDNTGNIGNSIVPENDHIVARTDTCKATSRTIMANNSILANSSDVYLGQYTDEESGTIFNSSFITQFACSEDFIFPEKVIGDTAKYTTLRLYFNEYIGDSLNAMKCEVYELDNTLIEGKPYYTNITPEDFYEEGKEPLATKTFNAIDFTQHDTILNGDYTRHIEIPLPNSIGKRFIKKFYETDSNGDSIGRTYFANSEAFINNIFKGIYVKCSHGDGTVFKIYRARIDIGFDRYIKSNSTGAIDSVQSLSAPFYSSKEVLQANKFDTKGLEELAEDNRYTYLKTPAGLFTEVTLPIESIKAEVLDNGVTINTAKVVFTRYNEEAGITNTAPSTILMVRKSEMTRFFLKNELNDGKTSYMTALNSSNNQYQFSNIANLLRVCHDEWMEGIKDDPEWTEKNPDWNKVVLIPVKTTEDSNGYVVKITHDTDIKSTRLRGGDNYEIPIEIISSKFND